MAYEAFLWHGHRLPQREQLGIAFLGLLREGEQIDARDFSEALRRQRQFAQQVRQLSQEGDIMLTPAALGPAPPVATTGDPAYNSPWSLAGVAAVALPCGTVNGLPVGLQLVSPAGSEGSLLRRAVWCERQLNLDEATR